MSGQFSVGVVIGGMIGSTFRSAMSGTRRALDSLSDTSRRLAGTSERFNPCNRTLWSTGFFPDAASQQRAAAGKPHHGAN